MSSQNNDFAQPVHKVAGCFIALLMLPLAMLAHACGVHPVSPFTFTSMAVIFLAGLGTLCGRPNTIVEAMRTILALFGKSEPPAEKGLQSEGEKTKLGERASLSDDAAKLAA